MNRNKERAQHPVLMIFLIVAFSMLAGWAAHEYAVLPAEEETPLEREPISYTPAVLSPGNKLSEDDIVVMNREVKLNIENALWARVADTNSMEPVLNGATHVIEVKPERRESISVGDIISYKTPRADKNILHRVIAVGEDKEGWYATAKGDNNPAADPERIRFNDIDRIVVAIIY